MVKKISNPEKEKKSSHSLICSQDWKCSQHYKPGPSNNDIILYYCKIAWIEWQPWREQTIFCKRAPSFWQPAGGDTLLMKHCAPHIPFPLNTRIWPFQVFNEMTNILVLKATWSRTKKIHRNLSGKHFCRFDNRARFWKVVLSSSRRTFHYLVHGWNEEDYRKGLGTALSLPLTDYFYIWRMWDKSTFCSCLFHYAATWNQNVNLKGLLAHCITCHKPLVSNNSQVLILFVGKCF